MAHRVNIDDLGGCSAGFEDLGLPVEHYSHVTAVCRLAKSLPASERRCRLCKAAANRRAVAIGGVVRGTCHLGLSDWIAGARLNGRIVAVVYLGSVRIGSELEASRQRLISSCQRMGLPTADFLSAWGTVPVVGEAEFLKGHQAVMAAAAFLGDLMVANGMGSMDLHPNLDAHVTGRYRMIPPHIGKALTIMREELGQPLRAGDLCRRLRVSPGHFSRSFSQAVGMPFSHCLLRMRLLKGRQLLRRTSLRVSEIAALTGFADQTHFGRAFRRAFGISPTTFRDQSP